MGFEEHQFTGRGDPPELLKAAAAAMAKRDAAHLAEHWSGAGLEAIGRFDIVRQHCEKLLARGKLFEASLLLQISTGATWPHERRKHVGMEDFEPLCPRCGAAPETDLHRYYMRQDNNTIEDSIMKDTKSYCKFAVKEEKSNAVLWMRGIPSAPSLKVLPPLDEPDIMQIGGPVFS